MRRKTPFVAVYGALAVVLLLAAGTWCLYRMMDQPDIPPVFQARFDRERQVFAALLDREDPFADPPAAATIYELLRCQDLRSGDVILRLMGGASSLLSAFSSLGGYSHVGIISREEDGLYVTDCQPHNGPSRQSHCIKRHPLQEWVKDFHFHDQVFPVLNVLVLRPDPPVAGETMLAVTDELLNGHVIFDSDFRLDNDRLDADHLYCSEFIYRILERTRPDPRWVFYSDGVTNEIIDFIQSLEKYPRYEALYGLVKEVQERFHVPARHVKQLIAPAAFEWSVRFRPVYYTFHPRIREINYHRLLSLYKEMKPGLILLRALDGLPVVADPEPFLDYADLPPRCRDKARLALADGRPAAGAGYDGNRLQERFLHHYALSHDTFEDIGHDFLNSAATTRIDDPPE
ncbi:MAG: hypothetical protein JXQ27_17390 [Acidobacteria bacterium]|nr:hypothetical protein [Acidobacteriota bacterium]